MCEQRPALTETQGSDTMKLGAVVLKRDELEKLRRQAIAVAQFLNHLLGYEPLLTGRYRKQQIKQR
ncbi:MAG: hypothetical protein ACE5LU_25580 [Anaerolineae bacterium]